jgi:acyl-CoA oxidase
LLLGRYHLPLPDANSSVLARHASSILEENSKLLREFPGGHRSEHFNSLILPQSEPAIEAIGHALAYTAAVEANLPQPILDVYECGVIRQDSAWYSENIGLSRIDQRIREDKAITSMLPHLSTYLADLDIDKYVSAPIVSDRRWKEYLDSLPVFIGNALPEEIHLFQARL